MITKCGIYYKIEDSRFIITINERKYYFSSALHSKNFLEKLQENRDIINKSLSKRFDVCIKYDSLCDLVLYKKIESRGFLIIEGDNKLCQNNLILNGSSLKEKN